MVGATSVGLRRAGRSSRADAGQLIRGGGAMSTDSMPSFESRPVQRGGRKVVTHPGASLIYEVLGRHGLLCASTISWRPSGRVDGMWAYLASTGPRRLKTPYELGDGAIDWRVVGTDRRLVRAGSDV